MLMVTPAVAQTHNPEHETFEEPKFNFLRFNEDWSGLKDVDPSKITPSEKIKYIKLSKDGNNWVSLGGHVRTRIESFQDFNFGTPENADDTFTLYRALFHADWHFGDNLRVFSEFKHADVSGRDLPGGARLIDRDRSEIQQLFVEYKFNIGDQSSLSLRVGRQEYGFGKSRLVSPLPWANSLRNWDGITGIFETQNLNVNFFYSSFNPVDQDSFNNNDSNNTLSGIYAKQKLNSNSGIEYYWLASERDDVSFNGTSGNEDRDTFGLRHWGKINPRLSYELEGAYQNGNVGSENVSAFMLAGDLTYAFAGESKSKLIFAIDYASGDDDAGGEVNTFNQLFP